MNAPLLTRAEDGEIEEIVGMEMADPDGIVAKTDTVLICSFAVANPGRPNGLPCSPLYANSPMAIETGWPPVAKTSGL